MLILKSSRYCKEEFKELRKILELGQYQLISSKCSNDCESCLYRHLCIDLCSTVHHLGTKINDNN